MDERNVPYIAHEGMMARMERTIKRLWILALVLTVLLVGTNVAWLYYESQFETVTSTEEYDYDAFSDSGHAIINGNGEVNINGEQSKSVLQEDHNNPSPEDGRQ